MSFDPVSIPSSISPRSKNRSLLSKFTAPFSNRNRNISEFYVQPDDPWKTYFPGDVVRGSVVLTVVKPLRITHLVVCLHGYVKVFKNPVASGDAEEDSGFLGTGRGRRGGEYLGNGFASLFEDEVVLCGDGRLKEGVYRFNFELEFPQDNLPTSINFERGTISYMITSTLTRPTTISPTMTCDKRVMLLENVDIAPLPAPKPRIISLEPVPKKPKSKSKGKNISGEQLHEVSSRDSSANGVAPSDHRPALSPVPSEISGSSCVSNSTQSFQIVADPNSNCSASARNSEAQSTSTASSDKTITATTELLRAGALPGDTIPLKISINHTKPLRSPHAIIVTLYRQGRIDTHPSIPVGTPEKGKKPVYEDCYPKSRTGLGGLNFGATKSSTAFRKDLSQTFAPLIVDPNTMTAVVRTSVRIPEDSFPTITRVPGAMIGFRYYIEVVIDLRGKVAGQDRFLSRLNMTSLANNYSPSGQVLNMVDKGRIPITSTWAGNILNTDQIRREKGVVACMFEIIVGSKDTGRGQRRWSDESSPEGPPTPCQPLQPGEDWREEDQTYQRNIRFDDQEHVLYDQYADGPPQDHWPTYPGQDPSAPPGQFIPPPQPEENVDEKTRLQRAEEMLLPSRPPDENGVAGPSELSISSPSAPSNPELSNGGPPYQYHPSSLGGEPGASHLLTSALSVDTIVPRSSTAQLGPSSPATVRHDDNYTQPDDKQELERQRLLVQASAPPASDHEEDNLHGDSADTAVSPTAPTLSDENQYSHIMNQSQHIGLGEPLPRYQR